MEYPKDFTECFAVPGARSIIDGVHPETGRSIVHGETLEQVQARCPGAVLMRWEDWRAEQARQQQTPITWSHISERKYHDMLNVLPPAAWIGDHFLVGEPVDHCWTTGRARFACYSKTALGAYVTASRPMTVAEFRQLARGRAIATTVIDILTNNDSERRS